MSSEKRSIKTTAALATIFISIFVLFSCNANTSFASAQPTIHVTDLWHPHGDPDDHWDLATQYALAYLQQIDLKGIIIDYPLAEQDKSEIKKPDLIGVAMMNMITNLEVPITIGSKYPMKQQPDSAGEDQILRVLRSCEQPVVIHITGSSRDVAIAGKKDPKLFAKKCKAIYLNAGWAAKNPNQECNVNYDPVAFQTIFELPCPVYWIPCNMDYIDSKPYPIFVKGEFASEYSLKQKDVLPFLSPCMQNYFGYMYRDGIYQKQKKQHDIYWLSYLIGPVEKDVIDYHSQHIRGMWCSAGFIHGAGKAVTKEGKLIPLNQGKQKGVFTFEPIEIKFKTPRNFTWKLNPKSKKLFIIHIKNQEHYEQGMNKAMKTLIQSLP